MDELIEQEFKKLVEKDPEVAWKTIMITIFKNALINGQQEKTPIGIMESKTESGQNNKCTGCVYVSSSMQHPGESLCKLCRRNYPDRYSMIKE